MTSAVEAMKLGAADCLVKPVDQEELRMLVAKLLDGQPESRTMKRAAEGDLARTSKYHPVRRSRICSGRRLNRRWLSTTATERMPPRR